MPQESPLVAFDESGNTGQDLLNTDQPVYVLASVGVSEADVASVIPSLAASGELSFRRLRRSAPGRSLILSILDSPVLHADSVKVCAVHKSFMVTCKSVDELFEPVLAASGLDLYQRGAHLATANLWHHVLPPLCSPSGFAALQAAFVQVVRTRSQEAGRRLLTEIDTLIQECREPRLREQLEVLMMGAVAWCSECVNVEDDGGVNALDPSVPSVISLAQSWAQAIGSFQMLHDDRPELERWQPTLERLWDRQAEQVSLITYRGDVLRYPLPVDNFVFGRSESHRLLQLADVIAGAAKCVLSDLVLSDPNPRFVESLRATRLETWLVGATVWPSRDVTPESLESRDGATPFLADAMASWLPPMGASWRQGPDSRSPRDS